MRMSYLFTNFSIRGRVSDEGGARDNDGNTCPLAVFKFVADVRVFVFCEIDGSSGVKPDARCGVIRQCGRLLLRICREMILHLLRIEFKHIELLHEADHLRTIEVAERVAGQAQTNWRCLVRGMPSIEKSRDTSRISHRSGDHCTRSNKISTGEGVCQKRPITQIMLCELRHGEPSPSRTRVPTSSSLPGRPGFVRLSRRDATPG